MESNKQLACADCEGTRVANQDFVEMKSCPTCAAQVAVEFSRVLRRWLPAADVAEAVRRNKREPLGSQICHSHDFCDANEAMVEAFHNLGLKTNIDHDGWEAYINRESNADEQAIDSATALWNAAWIIAIAAGFSPSLCAPGLGAPGEPTRHLG